MKKNTTKIKEKRLISIADYLSLINYCHMAKQVHIGLGKLEELYGPHLALTGVCVNMKMLFAQFW